jgi:hypothetical protein
MLYRATRLAATRPPHNRRVQGSSFQDELFMGGGYGEGASGREESGAEGEGEG